MTKKLILTEQQHAVIISEILKETVQKINSIKSGDKIDEGVWDSVKYGLSKLGRYKANGKIFGKNKVDAEYAEKIKNIIDDKANETIKKLDDNIKETNPQFPNNEDPQLFLQTVMEIAAVYDSIVASTKLSKEEGGTTIDIANGLIENLKIYVNKFLDVDLKAVYSVTNENECSEEDALTEDQMCQIDEYFGLDEALPARTGGSQVSASNPNPQVSGQASAGNYQKNSDIQDVDYEEIPNKNEPLDAKDVRSKLQAKKGDGEDFASTRMDTLKSNKLPMTLAGVGASLGAFSWLVNTEWFKSLFDAVTKNPSIEYIKQVVQEKTNVFASIQPNEGMTQIMNRLNGMNLNPNSSPQDFINGVKQLGGGNVNDGIDALCQRGGIFTDPESARKALTEIVKNPNAHGSNLGEMFKGQWAGTGKSLGDVLVTQTGGGLKGMIVNTIVKAVPKLVIRTGVKTGAGYALAKGFGAILGPIGIGLVTTGVVVKLMRMKGQKSSRAATLNALFQSLQGLKGDVGIISAEDVDSAVDSGKSIGAGTDDATGDATGDVTGDATGDVTGAGSQKTANTTKNNNSGTGANNDDLYNSLRNLFGFIVNSEKKFGRGPKNPLAEALLDEEIIDEAKYFRDKSLVNYLNKNVSPTRVVEFENLLNRVEQLRNKIRNIKPTGDKVFDQFLERFRQNPISMTDFNKMFNVVTVNQQAFQNMANFINDIFKTIYTGKYKQSGLIDKLGGMGRMTEADPNAVRTQFERNAQDRKKFKKHLLQFLDDSIALFQYMVKLRKQAAASGKQTKTRQPKQNVSAAPRQKAAVPKQQSAEPQQTSSSDGSSPDIVDKYGQTSMDLKENKLMEELNRIKKIMLS